MRGIHKVVQLEDAVAVVADNWWRAKKALDALAITWEESRSGVASSRGHRPAIWPAGWPPTDGGVGRQDGDVGGGLARAARRVAADYAVPFLAHATLEPQNATAHVVHDPVSGDRVEVWAPTQNGEAALAAAAQAAGVPLAQRGRPPLHAGRRLRPARPARRILSRWRSGSPGEVEQPVKVLWSREEDIRHDFYRPAAMARMTAGLDDDGMPVAWQVRLTGSSLLLGFVASRAGRRHAQEGFLEDMPYDIPHYLVDYRDAVDLMCRSVSGAA